MLYSILIFLFIIVCFTLILLILTQKGKSSLGMGGLGGGNQMLFGGSGGQDVFQKTTWFLGAIFMAGSLILAIMKKPDTSDLFKRLEKKQPAQQVPSVKDIKKPTTAATNTTGAETKATKADSK